MLLRNDSFNLRLPSDIKTSFKELSFSQGLSMSQSILMLINQAIERGQIDSTDVIEEPPVDELVELRKLHNIGNTLINSNKYFEFRQELDGLARTINMYLSGGIVEIVEAQGSNYPFAKNGIIVSEMYTMLGKKEENTSYGNFSQLVDKFVRTPFEELKMPERIDYTWTKRKVVLLKRIAILLEYLLRMGRIITSASEEIDYDYIAASYKKILEEAREVYIGD